MDTIISEMKRAIAYYQEKYKDENIGGGDHIRWYG